MSVYADTSFLASLYVLDANSPAAAAQMRKAELPVLLTTFGETELANALSLRIFRKELPRGKAAASFSLFQKDIESGVFVVKPVPAMLFERSKKVARLRTPELGTRTLDVLHVVSAALLGARVLYTFDWSQARLAKAEGLEVWPG